MGSLSPYSLWECHVLRQSKRRRQFSGFDRAGSLKRYTVYPKSSSPKSWMYQNLRRVLPNRVQYDMETDTQLSFEGWSLREISLSFIMVNWYWYCCLLVVIWNGAIDTFEMFAWKKLLRPLSQALVQHLLWVWQGVKAHVWTFRPCKLRCYAVYRW